MDLDLSTCTVDVFIEISEIQNGIKAVCTDPEDSKKLAVVGYDASGEELVVYLDCSDEDCESEAMQYTGSSPVIAQGISIYKSDTLVVTTTSDVKLIDLEGGSYDTLKVDFSSSGEFLASLVAEDSNDDTFLFLISQDSSNGEIGFHSFSVVDVYTSLTDNGKITIDHSYSSNAIARFAFEENSSYVYMCSHQISGVGATYFDMIDTGSGTVVTMTDTTYSQCLGAYSDKTDEASFLLLMATNKYRHITIDFTGGLNNVVV